MFAADIYCNPLSALVMTEHNIFQEVQEDLERQRIEALWKRYGSLIMTLALVIVLGTAGASAYRSWHAQHNQKLTDAYLEAAKQDSNPDKAIPLLEQFADSNPGSNQADFALLHAGALSSSKSDTAKAVLFYDAVAHDPTAEPAFRQLGDLLSVQAQMDTGDVAALSARLDPLTSEDGVWRYSALEDQAYLALKAGNKDKALKIFTTLSQDTRVPPGINARATDLMHSLN